MITGCVVINLANVDLAADPYSRQNTDRHMLDVLRAVPDGARVVVDIGNRQHVSQDAAVWLHDHDHRLEVEIRGTDPAAVSRFIRAGRAGSWDVIA